MSKPWFHIDSVTYSSGIVTLTFDAGRLRGGGLITLDGFSNSLSATENESYGTNLVLTFSAPVLGTSSTATTTEPTLTWTFGGTTSTTTNIRFAIGGSQLSSFTASGTTLSTALDSMVGGFVFASTASGFSATVSTSGNTSSVIFTAPTKSGNFYNGTNITATIARGTGSLTWSSTGLPNVATFSGGSTTYNLQLGFPSKMVVPVETISVTSLTASVL